MKVTAVRHMAVTIAAHTITSAMVVITACAAHIGANIVMVIALMSIAAATNKLPRINFVEYSVFCFSAPLRSMLHAHQTMSPCTLCDLIYKTDPCAFVVKPNHMSSSPPRLCG